MTVSSKIGFGLGLLIVLLLAVHSYHVTRVRRLAAASRDLQAVQFQAALVAVEQLRLIDELEDTTRRLFVTADQAYLVQIERLRETFGVRLGELRRLRLSASEARAVERLEVGWRALPLPSMPDPEETTDSPALGEQLARLAEIRLRTQEVGDANRTEVAAKVERSLAASLEAQRISWSIAAIAPVLTIAIGLWTIRSIREPLAELMKGTRAVAGGELTIQLEPARSDEFGRVAAAFNAMVRRLGELDRLKKDFLAQVSHELKTPLVAMQETDKLMLEEIAGPLNAKQRRMIELHLASSRRLSAMITNLLDLARLEAGAVEYDIKTHDLAEIVRLVLGELEARIRERGLRLEVSLPAVPLNVCCDGDRIVQVIENLVENAVKFSPAGSALSVRLASLFTLPSDLPERWRRELERGERERGAELERSALFAVVDAGPGVPDADKERIFDKFQQVGADGPRAKGGVGLGLAICREIVEVHRGAVWVADPPEGGSIFYLLLPALVPKAAPVSKPFLSTSQPALAKGS